MLPKRIFTGLIAIALVFAMFATATAQTTVMQQTTTVSTSYTFNMNLTIGSTGPDVVALQSILVAKGFLTMPVGVSMGYFGPLTRSALAAMQASVGISPAVGYFGPITRAYFNTHNMTSSSTTTTTTVPGCAPGALFSSTTGAPCNSTTTPPSPSNGDEGRLTNIDEAGGTDSSVEEGDTDAKVLAVSMDVEDGDVTIERVDVDFDLSGSTGSSNLAQYVSSVSLWLDDEKLAEQDVDEGDRDDDVTSFRFSGLDGDLEEGDSAKLYVAVDAINGIDADEEGQTIEAEIPVDGIRTMTGDNVSETYDNTALNDTFSVGEASAGDMTLSSDESDNPDVTVEADDEDTTTDVSLLKFSLKSKDQMNTVREITVDLVATGATSSGVIIDEARLLADGDEIDSKALAAGDNSVNFDDLDYDIDEDDEVEFEVVVDINALDGAHFVQGDSVAADIDSADIEAEDENGDDADVSGSAEGGTITFRTEGLSLSNPVVSDCEPSTECVDDHGDASATDSTGEWTIQFKVNAFGDTVYIPLTTARSSSTTPSSAGVYYVIEDANGNVLLTGTTTAAVAVVSGGSTSGGFVHINDGQSATLKLSVSFDPAVNGFHRAQLYGVNFKATSSGTPDQQVVASPQEDYQTGYANIQ